MKNLKHILIGLVCVLGLTIGGLWLEHARLKAGVAALRARLLVEFDEAGLRRRFDGSGPGSDRSTSLASTSSGQDHADLDTLPASMRLLPSGRARVAWQQTELAKRRR